MDADPSKYNVNKRNRCFVHGPAVGDDLRRLVVTLIMEAGGNPENRFIPYGVLSRVADSVKLANSTVKAIWDRFCETGSVAPLPPGGGRKKKLQEHDLLYAKQLKVEKPSIYLKEVQTKLSMFANVDVSLSTICKSYKHYMNDGPWTRKVMVTPSAERFTRQNLQYTQAYLNYVSRQNPYKLRFFDESGFFLPDTLKRRYGHAPKGQPAVEVSGKTRSPHLTLNLMIGLDGVAYANVVEGATDTDRYLNFFHEAANSVNDMGRPALVTGDIVIVDNCATHRNRGQLILGRYLANQGIQYVFLPTYSPDLNPVELCFRHIKTLMKGDPYMRMAKDVSLDYAILRAVMSITPGDARCYFQACEYMNVN